MWNVIDDTRLNGESKRLSEYERIHTSARSENDGATQTLRTELQRFKIYRVGEIAEKTAKEKNMLDKYIHVYINTLHIFMEVVSKLCI